MSEWKEYKIEEFAEVVGGGTPSTKEPKYYGGNIPWLTPKDLTNHLNKLIVRGERNITKEGFENSSARMVPQNTILLTSRAPIGYMAIAANEVCTNQGFKSIVVNPKIADFNYVYYLLKANLDYIKSFGTGTTFAEISASVVKNLKFKIPDLPTQTAIAEILSSLDDKIELNNKINLALEQLAQTLFKQWFIDFEFPNENGEPYKSSGGEMVESELGEIPKGWYKIKLGELVTKSHTGADAITRAPIVDFDTGIKCARVGDLTNNRSFHNWANCKISPADYSRHKLEIGDIIVTRTATLGINQIIREDINAVCNNGLIRLQFDKTVCDPMFVFVQLQGNNFKEWIKRISGDSSTRPNMQMDYLLDFQVIIPKLKIMNVFTDLIKAYYDLIDENNRGTENIIKTRDTLLPKLISGELAVSSL